MVYTDFSSLKMYGQYWLSLVDTVWSILIIFGWWYMVYNDYPWLIKYGLYRLSLVANVWSAEVMVLVVTYSRCGWVLVFFMYILHFWFFFLVNKVIRGSPGGALVTKKLIIIIWNNIFSEHIMHYTCMLHTAYIFAHLHDVLLRYVGSGI